MEKSIKPNDRIGNAGGLKLYVPERGCDRSGSAMLFYQTRGVRRPPSRIDSTSANKPSEEQATLPTIKQGTMNPVPLLEKQKQRMTSPTSFFIVLDTQRADRLGAPWAHKTHQPQHRPLRRRRGALF